MAQSRSRVTKLLFVEGFLYAASLSLFDSTSVVAMFLSNLGASAWLIGLASTIKLVGVRAPQLFVATQFSGRLTNLLVRFVSFQWLATVLMVFAPVVAVVFGMGPALISFMVGWVCFSFGEGAYFVPWSEAVAGAVGRKCGQFLGVYGLVESLGTLFAGAVVYAVGRAGFIGTYSGFFWMFVLGSIGLLVTVPVMRRVKHYDDIMYRAKSQMKARPDSSTHNQDESILKSVKRILSVPSRGFKAFLGAELLSMGVYLMAPFILLYGQHELGLTARVTSLSVWAEMAGISLGCVLAGWFAARFGSKAIVKLTCISSAAVPIFVLLIGILQISVSTQLKGIFVMLSMMFLGVFHGSSWVGCTGYIVEKAQEAERPTILGALNFLMLPFLCLGPIGGLTVKYIGYTPVFVVAMVFTLISASLSLKVT